MKFGQYSTFAFVDVETTGTSASHDRVLEIGIIRVENGIIVGQINTLLDPEVYIPPEITTITGITGGDILDAPHFTDVVGDVEQLLKDAVFVAHNARFDYAFMKHEFKRLGLPFSLKTLDTVKLARTLLPSLPRHNLDSIIQYLGINVENRHRAYDDAKVLFNFLSHIHTRMDQTQTEKIFEQMLKNPALPTQITKEQINTLPDGPGVYLMYDKADTLLYVGKSVDIKARVLSHFYNDFDSPKDLLLSREVARIEAKPTAGDLGASLLESQLIKSLYPIYNKFLRRGRGAFALLLYEENEYMHIKLVNADKIPPEQYHNILGVHQSKKSATVYLREMTKEYHLCAKLMGLEIGKGRCFGTQIGVCLGACIGEEPAFKYNVRFLEAFSKKRVPNWPFPGVVGIREVFENLEEVHVIYNWCYLGSITHESENLEEVVKKDLVFNWDAYKIIARFIKKHAKANTILHLHDVVSPSHTEQQ